MIPYGLTEIDLKQSRCKMVYYWFTIKNNQALSITEIWNNILTDKHKRLQFVKILSQFYWI